MPTLADVLRQTGYSQDGTLATPTPTDSPMTKVLSDYVASIPQKFAQNQQNQMDLLSQAFPGNTYESMMTQGDPKALAELAMQAPFNAMIAYHGTPHNILGKFDISKVGTGEGAQAYGHGMYFAENPSVAGQYKTALSNIEMSSKGKPLTEYGINEKVTTHSPSIFDNPLDYGLAEYNKSLKTQLLDYPELKNDPNFAKTLFDERVDFLKSWGKGTKEEKAAEAMQKFVKKNGYPDVNLGGNLYKVDIPDEYIPNMLDWDKPLSKQSKVVQDALAKIDKDLYHPSGSDYDSEELGQMIYSRLKAINSAKGSIEADKAASEMLNNMGIKGIRYLDQGSRPIAGGEIIDIFKTPEGWKSKIKVTNRTGLDFQNPADMFTTSMPFKTEAEAKKWAQEKIGGGTSNFVVFDPSEVKILEKNSKPVSRKELLEQQVNKLKD